MELYMEQQELQTTITHIPKAIKFVVSDAIRTDHATHLIVQQQGSELMLLFFEATSPIFMGSPEEQIAAYKELQYIEAKCVAKVVMSTENAILGANNLIESLNRYQAAVQQAMKGQENAVTGTQENTKQSTSSS
jgi:hypothetical protein